MDGLDAAVPREGMAWIDGGSFLMGSDRHYPEEGPAHRVSVEGFWIDKAPVTNREFASFVAATGYVTFAETVPDASLYPGAAPELLRPGSLVFTPPGRPVNLNDSNAWWRLVFDADWRRPAGPDQPDRAHDDHPVTHVNFDDASAYAAWAGKTLPSEAQWEFAARGGLKAAEYAWGDAFTAAGQLMANTWHGAFPNENLSPAGFTRTSPVRAFPANGYGLFDMIGNVWEWTDEAYLDRHRGGAVKSCCGSGSPRAAENVSARKVLKGGSHLCAPNYCRRYRPAARHPQTTDTSTSHIGFRCVALG